MGRTFVWSDHHGILRIGGAKKDFPLQSTLSVECLLKIPHSGDLHQQHNHPVILSGGFGEVSSLSLAQHQNRMVS